MTLCPAESAASGFAFQPVASRNPRLVESTVIAVADSFRHGPDLAEIRPAIGNIGDRPAAEILMQLDFLNSMLIANFPNGCRGRDD